MIVGQKKVDKWAANWNTYTPAMLSCLQEIKTFIGFYDPQNYAPMQKKAALLLEKLNRLYFDLKKFQKRGQKLLAINQNQVQSLLDDMRKNYLSAVTTLIQLQKILALGVYKHFLKKRTYKKQGMELLPVALEGIQVAVNLYEEHKKDLQQSSFDGDIAQLYVEISYYHYIYGQDSSGEEKKIRDLLHEALNDKNFDGVYEKFQQAINLLKDPKIKLLTYYAQASNSKKLNQKNTNYEHIKKIFVSTKEAFNLIPQLDAADLNPFMIQLQFCFERSASTAVTFCHQSINANNYSLQKEILTAALDCLTLSEKHPSMQDGLDEGYHQLKSSIVSELETIETKLEAEQKEKENQKKSLSIEELQAIYDKKFVEIYNSFLEKKRDRKQKKQKNNNNNNNNNNTADDINEDDVEIEEEAELIPNYINYYWEPAHVIKYSPRLPDLLDSLTKSQESFDKKEQSRVLSNLAEYYRVEAGHCFKQGWKTQSEGIRHLKDAIKYLEEGMHLLDLHEKETGIEQAVPKECMQLILDMTQTSIEKHQKLQKERLERFEASRKEVMAYIIATYGEDEWFKKEPFDWEKLSENAKIRITTEKTVQRLDSISRKMETISANTNEFLKPTEHSKINEYSQPVESSKEDLEHNLFSNFKDKPAQQSDYQSIVSLTKQRASLFFNEHEPRILKRSQSINSFLDENEEKVRTIIRKDFGR